MNNRRLTGVILLMAAAALSLTLPVFEIAACGLLAVGLVLIIRGK